MEKETIIAVAIVATGEHAAAFGSSILSLIFPVIIAALVILTVVFLLTKFGKRLSSRKKT